MAIKLSKRLSQIYNLIGQSRVADIGSDHGKLMAKAFTENKITFAILSDISRKSAEKPRQLLLNIPNAEFDIRVGDGLSTITAADEIDEVIISGLGGLEIIHILKAAKITFKSYILQPQNHAEQLKYYLIDNNYNIVFDKIVYDNKKFYNILRVQRGKSNAQLEQIILGLNNQNNADFKLYLAYLKDKYTQLLPKVTCPKKQKQLKTNLKIIEGEMYE